MDEGDDFAKGVEITDEVQVAEFDVEFSRIVGGIAWWFCGPC